MQPNIIQQIKTAPKNPGVYIFYRNQTPLYIGKASNLKNRLQNYLKITDWKNEALHREADKLKLIKLHSNIEALIVESQLIKTLRPKLNTLWKDDKNYFYVAATREKFPKIFLTHQPQANGPLSNAKSNFIGPFTEGQSIKAILRLLRKFFPYCTCFQPHLRLCLNAQIGNCPGYCCQLNDKQLTTNGKQLIRNYNKNIKKIKNILAGKDRNFIRKLKDPYELLVLEKIWQHQPYLDEIPKTKNLDFQKIECYDNSHLSGKEAIGAMTAWIRPMTEWIADKNSWRKFKIRGQYTEDDPRMMEEVLSRRLNHPEWPYPDLIIIDGGITQFNAAKKALNQIKNLKPIKIISFAKPQEQIYGWNKYPVPLRQLPPELQKIIGLAIAQTHRFARNYHRQIRQRNLLKL